jgi:hypothetical protein
MPQVVPLHVAVPLAVPGQGVVHWLPQVATSLFDTH